MNQLEDKKGKSSADMTEAEASSEGQKLAEKGGGSRVVMFRDFGAFQTTSDEMLMNGGRGARRLGNVEVMQGECMLAGGTYSISRTEEERVLQGKQLRGCMRYSHLSMAP